jgi:osmotically inducible protein OsmC
MAIFSRRSELRWDGEVIGGSGRVTASSGAFAIPVTFPSTAGEPAGKTTPEELLAASHASCYGIGLRSQIGRRGGRAQRVTAEAVVSAEKGAKGIRIQSIHLTAVVAGLEGLDAAELQDIAREVAAECTISIVLRGAVPITHELKTESG